MKMHKAVRNVGLIRISQDINGEALYRYVGPDGALRNDGRKFLQGKRS